MSDLTEMTSGGGAIAEPLERAADLLANLVEAARSAGDTRRARLQYALEKALAALGSGTPAEGSPQDGLARWQAKRLDAYIRDHIGSCLKVRELAAQLQLSSGHFSRMFKLTFRETPTAYLMRQRVRYAQERMLTSDRSLAQIALDCGFSDQSHFSRVFRRVVGRTPRRWRRDCRAI